MAFSFFTSSGSQKTSGSINAPIGAVLDYAGSTAPDGWLLCDGTAVSRSTYANLFNVIGTTFGSGDGSTTFDIPDLRGRVTIGAGTGVGEGSSGTGAPSGTSLTARTTGDWGGKETHKLTGAESGTSVHGHNNTITYGNPTFALTAADHTHAAINSGLFASRRSTTGGSLALASGAQVWDLSANTVGSGALAVSGSITQGTKTGSVTDSVAADASSAHTNVQPFAVLNKIIKY